MHKIKLTKEVLPAGTWDPCRRPEDRSPPIAGILGPIALGVLLAMSLFTRFVCVLAERDSEREHAAEVQRREIQTIEERAREALDRPRIETPTIVVDPVTGARHVTW